MSDSANFSVIIGNSFQNATVVRTDSAARPSYLSMEKPCLFIFPKSSGPSSQEGLPGSPRRGAGTVAGRFPANFVAESSGPKPEEHAYDPSYREKTKMPLRLETRSP